MTDTSRPRILIIDDASTDDTHLVAAALAAEDERVAVLRHPVNLGHVATYNEAIGLAEGDYFELTSLIDTLRVHPSKDAALASLDGDGG